MIINYLQKDKVLFGVDGGLPYLLLAVDIPDNRLGRPDGPLLVLIRLEQNFERRRQIQIFGEFPIQHRLVGQTVRSEFQMLHLRPFGQVDRDGPGIVVDIDILCPFHFEGGKAAEYQRIIQVVADTSGQYERGGE